VEDCPYENAHMSDCMDSLTVALPVYLYHRNNLQGQELFDKTVEGIKIIRPITDAAEHYVKIFIRMMDGAFKGVPVDVLAKEAAS